MTLSLSKDVNIYSFSNENVDYRKNYTSYYVPEVTLTGSHSFAEDG